MILDLDATLDRAFDRIAPAWPLDRAIAVNPWWGWIDQPFAAAAAALAGLGGVQAYPDRDWLRARLDRASDADITAALRVRGLSDTPAELRARLARPALAAATPPRITDLVGRGAPTVVRDDVSRACAVWADAAQAARSPRREGLYATWWALARPHAPSHLRDLGGRPIEVDDVPPHPRAAIQLALDALGVPEERIEAYAVALLLDVNGWAAMCAHRRWEARQAGGDDDALEQLLAARMTWEVLLLRAFPTLSSAWSAARTRGWAPDPSVYAYDEAALRACEIAQARPWIEAFAARPARPVEATPAVEAVFCIDVRSERLRRALEAVAPTVRTRGFAGFFGLPIAWRTPDGDARPQLPGLLSPALLAHDGEPAAAPAPDDPMTSAPGSVFTRVEALGLGAFGALVRDSLGWRAPWRDAQAPRARPRLVGPDGAPLPTAARVDLAARVLGAMGLQPPLAPVVALIGHGASADNQPQLASLHCGACGGQTGEVNARALAGLLADADVRAGLAARGIDLGATAFVAALHDTTTDDVAWFDVDLVPEAARGAWRALRDDLVEAGRRVRRERAPDLGVPVDADVDAAIRARANDWAEVRPEWGLAGNAAFVIAPRARTRGLHLDGRVFLHDYRWEDDPDRRVLELLLTAPMLVTHWINLQYYASTVDPARFGSGDKTLHNVVGGRVGVLEGAAGDLRIGLATQSLSDARGPRHDPLRLAVFVDAPADAIDAILARHRAPRDLVLNGWLHLYRLGDRAVWWRGQRGWSRVD